jgi:hypothetical protein
MSVRFSVVAALTAAVSVVAGCGTISFDNLVAVISQNGIPTNWCSPDYGSSAKVTRALVVPNGDALAAQIETGLAKVPSLKGDAVFKAIYLHTKYISLNSVALAMNPKQQVGPPPKTKLTQQDFINFAKVVEENIIRQSGGQDIDQAARQRLLTYFQEYSAGSFVGYYGTKYDQPQVSLSIPDKEINETASVGLEFFFDELFQTPVWYGDDGNYYPAGNKNTPTVIKKGFLNSVPIASNPPTGCGMNVTKAKMIMYLAHQFSAAASADTGLTIKSIGGLEVGLGVLGKLSVGDNNTLSGLVQTVVVEAVDRMTAQMAYPILTALDYGGPQGPPVLGASAPGSRLAGRLNEKRPPQAKSIEPVTVLFASPNPQR